MAEQDRNELFRLGERIRESLEKIAELLSKLVDIAPKFAESKTEIIEQQAPFDIAAQAGESLPPEAAIPRLARADSPDLGFPLEVAGGAAPEIEIPKSPVGDVPRGPEFRPLPKEVGEPAVPEAPHPGAPIDLPTIPKFEHPPILPQPIPEAAQAPLAALGFESTFVKTEFKGYPEVVSAALAMPEMPQMVDIVSPAIQPPPMVAAAPPVVQPPLDMPGFETAPPRPSHPVEPTPLPRQMDKALLPMTEFIEAAAPKIDDFQPLLNQTYEDPSLMAGTMHLQQQLERTYRARQVEATEENARLAIDHSYRLEKVIDQLRSRR